MTGFPQISCLLLLVMLTTAVSSPAQDDPEPRLIVDVVEVFVEPYRSRRGFTGEPISIVEEALSEYRGEGYRVVTGQFELAPEQSKKVKGPRSTLVISFSTQGTQLRPMILNQTRHGHIFNSHHGPVTPESRIRKQDSFWATGHNLNRRFLKFRVIGDELDWGEALPEHTPEAFLDNARLLLGKSREFEPHHRSQLASYIIDLGRFVPIPDLDADGWRQLHEISTSTHRRFQQPGVFQNRLPEFYTEQAMMCAGIEDGLPDPEGELFGKTQFLEASVQELYAHIARDASRSDRIRTVALVRSVNADRNVDNVDRWLRYARSESLPADAAKRESLLERLEGEIAGRRPIELLLFGVGAFVAIFIFLFGVRRFARRAMFA